MNQKSLKITLVDYKKMKLKKGDIIVESKTFQGIKPILISGAKRIYESQPYINIECSNIKISVLGENILLNDLKMYFGEPILRIEIIDKVDNTINLPKDIEYYKGNGNVLELKDYSLQIEDIENLSIKGGRGVWGHRWDYKIEAQNYKLENFIPKAKAGFTEQDYCEFGQERAYIATNVMSLLDIILTYNLTSICSIYNTMSEKLFAVCYNRFNCSNKDKHRIVELSYKKFMESKSKYKSNKEEFNRKQMIFNAIIYKLCERIYNLYSILPFIDMNDSKLIFKMNGKEYEFDYGSNEPEQEEMVNKTLHIYTILNLFCELIRSVSKVIATYDPDKSLEELLIESFNNSPIIKWLVDLDEVQKIIEE